MNRRLALQSIVGLPLTALALAGWFAFAALTASRWREAPERLSSRSRRSSGLAAVVYYATRSYRPDGDTVKALFLLPAVPFWALSFGFAVDVLVERSRRVGLVVARVLALCLLVSLSFGTYAFVS